MTRYFLRAHQLQDLEQELLALRSQFSEQRSERDREMEEVMQSLTLQVENLQVK